MAGAVHGLERVDGFFPRVFLIDFDDEHVVLIIGPVAGFFPQHTVHDLRRVHLDIAAAALLAAHVILQGGVDRPAVRVPEDLTGGFLLHVEEIHLAAQLAVVAFGGLLQHGQMRFQLVPVQEGRAIDALQHGPRAVAAPIGTRHMHQLERIRRHLPGVLQMRAPAKVLPSPMPIHPERFVTGDGVDEFHLVGFVVRLVMRDGAGAVPDLGRDGVALGDDLAHLLLDHGKVFGGEGLGAVEIVIPAVLDHRADGHFDGGPDFLHSAGHDMGKIVAHQFQRGGAVGHGIDGQRRVLRDRPLQIPMLAVQRGADRLFRKGFGNIGGDIGCGDAGVILACIAIGKGERDLCHIGLLVGLAPTERPVAGYIVRCLCDGARGPSQAGVGGFTRPRAGAVSRRITAKGQGG